MSQPFSDSFLQVLRNTIGHTDSDSLRYTIMTHMKAVGTATWSCCPLAWNVTLFEAVTLVNEFGYGMPNARLDMEYNLIPPKPFPCVKLSYVDGRWSTENNVDAFDAFGL